MKKQDIIDMRIPCQSIGCRRIACIIVIDSKGRKSYRCADHGKPIAPTGVKRK